MRWGLHLGNFGSAAGTERIVGLAQAAERLGFDSVWVSDHVAAPVSFDSTSALPGSTYDAEMGGSFYEALTTLAVVAGATSRVRLGTSVLVLPIRHPLLLARQIATLDVLSGGRVELGVGAGWLAEEFEAMGGHPFVSRGGVLDESLAILRLAWETRESDHDGRFYRFPALKFGPRPAQPGGPPITVGGHGRVSLRRAARFDGWQAARERPEALVKPLAALRLEVEERGRSWDSFRVLVRCRLGPVGASESPREGYEIAGDIPDVLGTIEGYAEVGATELLLNVPADVALPAAVELLERFAEAAITPPRVRGAALETA